MTCSSLCPKMEGGLKVVSSHQYGSHCPSQMLPVPLVFSFPKRFSMQWVLKACIPTYGLLAGRVREINRENKAHSVEQLSKAGASCRTVSMWTKKRQQHQTHDSAFHSHTYSVLLFLLLDE